MTAPPLVDTHCHLDAPQFADAPTADLLARAAQAGVGRVVTIGTDLATSEAALDLARAHDGLWATVGIDPNDAAGVDEAALRRLEALAAAPEVVAIGEIGLDYHWLRSGREVQLAAFRAQLDLAAALGLPVVVHDRDAHADTTDVLLGWAAGRPAGRPRGVMHCFSGDLAMARALVAAGFLVSLAGVVTFPSAAATREVAAGLPAGALVLETDAPWLAPHPRRGERNEPANVRLVAERVALLRGEPLAAVAAQTSANAVRLFGWEAA